MREYFRGVVWPREPIRGKIATIHRYVIVGMLVTDEPIPTFDGRNEIVIDGKAFGLFSGLAEVIESIPEGQTKYKFGDANDVLLNLSQIEQETDDGGGLSIPDDSIGSRGHETSDRPCVQPALRDDEAASGGSDEGSDRPVRLPKRSRKNSRRTSP